MIQPKLPEITKAIRDFRIEYYKWSVPERKKYILDFLNALLPSDYKVDEKDES